MDEHLPHDLPPYEPNVPPERVGRRGGRVNEMESRKVLMVGGPADGTWRVFRGAVFIHVEMPPITFVDDSPEPVKHFYERERFFISGHELALAICLSEPWTTAGRNRAVLRAILQRDVAAVMGVL